MNLRQSGNSMASMIDTSPIVLLSGGIDSTASLHFLSSRHAVLHSLFVDYGQPAAQHELAAARQSAEMLRASFATISCQGIAVPTAGEIAGRNALLMLLALATRPTASAIAIGLHMGTPYYDTTAAFAADSQQLLDGYTDGRTRLLTPFLSWSKSDILSYCMKHSLPIGHTYSCERGTMPPCGLCLSCQDRRALNA